MRGEVRDAFQLDRDVKAGMRFAIDQLHFAGRSC